MPFVILYDDLQVLLCSLEMYYPSVGEGGERRENEERGLFHKDNGDTDVCGVK